MQDYLERTRNGTSFSGSDMRIWNATVIASQLRLYASSGIRAHKGWTPTLALKWAGQELGMKFKRGQYELAAAMLSDHANKLKLEPYSENY